MDILEFINFIIHIVNTTVRKKRVDEIITEPISLKPTNIPNIDNIIYFTDSIDTNTILIIELMTVYTYPNIYIPSSSVNRL